MQLLAVPGLGDVAVDAAQVDRLDQHVDVGEGGEDDADGVGADVAHGLQQLEAGHARHALVGDHHRDVLVAGDLQRLLGAGGQAQREDSPKLKRNASRLSCSSSTTRMG